MENPFVGGHVSRLSLYLEHIMRSTIHGRLRNRFWLANSLSLYKRAMFKTRSDRRGVLASDQKMISNGADERSLISTLECTFDFCCLRENVCFAFSSGTSCDCDKHR